MKKSKLKHLYKSIVPSLVSKSMSELRPTCVRFQPQCSFISAVKQIFRQMKLVPHQPQFWLPSCFHVPILLCTEFIWCNTWKSLLAPLESSIRVWLIPLSFTPSIYITPSLTSHLSASSLSISQIHTHTQWQKSSLFSWERQITEDRDKTLGCESKEKLVVCLQNGDSHESCVYLRCLVKMWSCRGACES